MTRGRPKARSKRRDDLFFEAIENGATQKKACEISGYHVRAITRYKKNDADFKKRFEEAEDVLFSLAEDELRDFVFNGFVETKVRRDKDGKTEYTKTTKKSFQALQYYLRAKELKRYNVDRDEPQGSNDQLIELNFEDV